MIDKALRLLPSFSAGATISSGLDDGESICVMVSGVAFKSRVSASGTRHVAGFLLAGDACNLSSMFMPAIQQTVTASSRCEAAALPIRTLLQLADDYPTIMRALWIHSCIEEALMGEWHVRNGRKSAQQRMANLFCEIYVRSGLVGAAGSNDFPLPVSKKVLGDALGLNLVQTSRSLISLQKLGIAVFEDSRIYLPDVARIMNYADFDASCLSVDSRRLLRIQHGLSSRDRLLRPWSMLN